MLCGSMVTLAKNGNHIYDSMALIPLVFYFIEAGWQSHDFRKYLAAGAIMSLQNYSNGWQFSTYTLIMVMAYLTTKVFTDSKKSEMNDTARSAFTGFAVAAIAMLILSAILLLPSFQYSRESIRASADYDFFTSWSVHPAELLVYFVPLLFGGYGEAYWGHAPFIQTSIYLGILPLILSFFAFFQYRRERLVIALAAIMTLSLFLSLGKYNPVYQLLFHIPVISGFRDPGRWLIFFAFAASGLTGIAVDTIIARSDERAFLRVSTSRLLLLTVIAFIAAGCVYLANNSIAAWLQANSLLIERFGSGPELQSNSQAAAGMIVNGLLRLALALAAGTLFFFGAIRICQKKLPQAAVLVFLLFLILFIPDVWWTERDFIETVAPDANEAVFKDTEVFLKRNLDDHRFFFAPDLSQAGQENRFIRWQASSPNGYHGLPMLRYQQALKTVTQAERLLQLFNIKYVLTRQELRFPFLRYIDSQGPAGIRVYEYTSAPGFAYLIRDVQPVQDYNAALGQIQSLSADLRSTAFSEELLPVKLGDSSVSASETAQLTNSDINSLKFKATASGTSLLVINDAYYPAWKARVNGRPAKVYPINAISRGVIVPAGKSVVDMWYDPSLFYVGSVISGIGWLGLLILFIMFKKRS